MTLAPLYIFSFFHKPLTSCFFISHPLRNDSKLPGAWPPGVAKLSIVLELVERRVHYLLRERGGHCAVRLRTHVLVLRLRPQAQENGQRLLPHLQEDNQGHHQDIPQRIVGFCKIVCARSIVCVCAVVNQSHVILFVKAGVSLVHSMVAQVQ